jgi:S-adenosylmethionine:tRNA ribosyltransferase-isomerase
MMEPIYIADYNYPLPDERIAKYPLAERDHSKLLVYKPASGAGEKGIVTEDRFFNIGDYITPDALLIYNNTRVIQARLEFHKRSLADGTQGARIEVFCLEPLAPHDYQLSLGSTTGCTWKCMVGNAKKWHDEYLEYHVKR